MASVTDRKITVTYTGKGDHVQSLLRVLSKGDVATYAREITKDCYDDQENERE